MYVFQKRLYFFDVPCFFGNLVRCSGLLFRFIGDMAVTYAPEIYKEDFVVVLDKCCCAVCSRYEEVCSQ
jgi:hypothetical protein